MKNTTKTKDKPRKSMRQRDFNEAFRRAFFVVVETYNELRSTLGTAKAIDYAGSQLGKALYKNDIAFLRLIDFTIDVDKAVVDTLDGGDLVMFRECYKDQPDNSSKSTTEQMSMQERMGRIFMARHIYPVSGYFMVGK